jgi:hypothetical protein
VILFICSPHAFINKCGYGKQSACFSIDMMTATIFIKCSNMYCVLLILMHSLTLHKNIDKVEIFIHFFGAHNGWNYEVHLTWSFADQILKGFESILPFFVPETEKSMGKLSRENE